MPDKPKDEPTQETRPAKGPPAKIPIPTRGDVFRDLEKIAKPRKRREQEDQPESSE